MVAQIAVGLLSGIFGALLGTFIAPRIQHHFWREQRLADLRFATIKSLNRLMAEYLTGHIAKETGVALGWRPSTEFFVALREEETHIRTLFSPRAWTAYKAVEVMLDATGGLGPSGDKKTDQDFREAHDRTMRVLYEEIGLRLPKQKATNTKGATKS